MSRSALQGYLGFARQAVKGLAVAPTTFVRLTGKPTTAPVINLESHQEGPGRDLSLVTKQSQSFDGNFGFLARPRTAGMMLAAALGVDQVTGTVVAGGGATTLGGAAIAGATDITVASAANLAIDDIVQIDTNDIATGKVAECVKITAIVANTLTVAPALGFGHAIAAAVVEVQTPFSHIITPATDYSLPWYTIESAVADFIQRIQDVRIDGLTLSGKAGGAVDVAVDYAGLTGKAQAAETPQTYEPDVPVMFHGGVFTLDGEPIVNITDFNLALKNGLGRDDYTVDVVRSDVPVGRRDLEVGLTLEPESAARQKALYYGAADIPGKAPVSGSLILDFAYGADAAARGLKIEVPSVYYVAESIEHDPAGGRLTTAVKAMAVKSGASPLLTATVKTDSYLRM